MANMKEKIILLTMMMIAAVITTAGLSVCHFSSLLRLLS